MVNFLEAEKVSLDDLVERITTTDLVPSRAVLQEGLTQNIEKISQQGICNLADLKSTLKNDKKLEALARSTGIDRNTLILLRREVESYTPKPFKLLEIDWLPREELTRLIDAGIGNSDDLRALVREQDGIIRLEEKTGVKHDTMDYLICLADLGRVQWVSLNFARMLYEAGYTRARSVAGAFAEVLCERLEQINAGGKYFNGKVGLRDIKRLVHSAGFVC